MMWLLLALACTGEQAVEDDTGDPVGDDTGGETGETGVEEDLTVVKNFPDPCNNGGALKPIPEENGFFAATKLTPSVYPYTVNAVAVQVAHQGDAGESCDASLAQYVEIYMTSEDAPAATPGAIGSADFPVEAVDGDFRALAVAFEGGLVLNQGENLFVALRINAGPGGDTCPATCAEDGDGSINWWSNASAPPYPWASLQDFGIGSNYIMWAEGEPPFSP